MEVFFIIARSPEKLFDEFFAGEEIRETNEPQSGIVLFEGRFDFFQIAMVPFFYKRQSKKLRRVLSQN